MSFTDFPEQQRVVQLLQRSLARDRLAHAYLFTGGDLAELQAMARTLAKTLNCEQPRKGESGSAIDNCDRCPSCRHIDEMLHPDVHWVRPESKLRVVTIDQVRDLMAEVHLKPTEAVFKVAVIVGVDRLNVQAANAFLKTLEEPPPRSVLILLSTEPQRVLETIRSRCLRLNFAGAVGPRCDEAQLAWLAAFGDAMTTGSKGVLGRYHLLGNLMARLAQTKAGIEKALAQRSPLERYEDVDPPLREKWEEQLSAAVEAEYRRQRMDLIGMVQWWFRDVWLKTLALPAGMLGFGKLTNTTAALAKKISSRDALENLQMLEQTQRLLGSNVQEALALEVVLLSLKL